MGWYVHIHVCFACDRNAGVAILAKKHLAILNEAHVSQDDGGREAVWFLADLSQRGGGNSGQKGGLSLWGMVGNYTRVDVFCETLLPFWRDLLSGQIDNGPCDHERVIVFEEQEQREAATAYQIGWDDHYSPTRQMVITKYKNLPFSWMQM